MAERGAPNKKGLDYFPKMVNFYEDDKIFDLLEAFGPLGTTVYDVILTIVYAQGYYAEMPKDKLARMVVRKIGSRWIKKEAAVQVIDYCADIGLLHDALLSQGIITSVGIQKRYYRIGVKLMRRQLYNDKYWLLDKNGEPLLNAPKNGIIAEENQLSSAENPVSSEERPQKEKESKRKENKESGREKAPPARSAYGHYGNVVLSEAEYEALAADFGEEAAGYYIERLGLQIQKIGAEEAGRRYRSHEATIRSWIIEDERKEVRKIQSQVKPIGKPNRFHNYDQSGTDYEAVLKQTNGG